MHRLRALVADDDREELELVSGAVEEFGADVVRAGDREELLAAFATDTYDFIVADIAMPWVAGIQMLPMHTTPRPPIIVMSAHRDLALANELHALGEHVTLLYKPFSPEELCSALQSCVHDVIAARSQRVT